MADKKESPKERVFLDAKDGSQVDPYSGEQRTPSARRSGAQRKRIIAVVLWILAIGAEVVAIWTFNHYSVLWPSLAAIIADALLCVIAAQFWKQSNRMDPPKGKFIKNQFGVIMTLIAFLPLGYFLLRNSKEIPSGAKRILAVVAAAAFVLTMGMSIEYDPVSQSDLDQAEQMAIEYGGEAYWGKYSKSYHFDPDCRTLLNSAQVYQGTIEEAFELGKTDPCDFCAGGGESKSILENVLGGDESAQDAEE